MSYWSNGAEGDTADGGIDRELIADVAMLAAVDAWRHMHTYGFVPAPPPRAGGCGRCSTATAARRATRGGRWSPRPAASWPAAARAGKRVV